MAIKNLKINGKRANEIWYNGLECYQVIFKKNNVENKVFAKDIYIAKDCYQEDGFAYYEHVRPTTFSIKDSNGNAYETDSPGASSGDKLTIVVNAPRTIATNAGGYSGYINWRLIISVDGEEIFDTGSLGFINRTLSYSPYKSIYVTLIAYPPLRG